MVAKKKVTKSPTIPPESSISLEESIKEEVHTPVVTQVVEVVEEETSATEPEAVESHATASPAPMEDATPEPALSSVEPEPSVTETKESDQKRKVLVDELFQKTPAKPPEVMPEISIHKTSKTKPAILWAITLVVACLVVGGILFIASGKVGSFPSIVVVPTPTPTNTPMTTPTPTPGEVKRESLKIQVLNGGGKAGAATKMKKFLEDKGYTITDTANAPSYTYDKTEILVKPAFKAYISLLEEDLADDYTLGSSAATLEDSVSYDARVIVGKE